MDFAVVDPLIGYKVNPTADYNYFCQRQLASGVVGTLADPVDYYGCVVAPAKFKWDGVRLSLEEPVECGG